MQPDLSPEDRAAIANELLWALQHGLWDPLRNHRIEERHHRAWESYRAVNRYFAESIANEPGDRPSVLVQDYHLYLLPGLLRELRPGARILHFTHIPWPPPVVWSALGTRNGGEVISSAAY